MRQYETIFVVNPTVVEETYREVVNKFKGIIEKQKGVLVKAEEWGIQRLAYTVRKSDKGAYVLFNYCGDAGVTMELERDLKLDDRILKYQTVKLAEDVDPQALMPKAEEGKKEPEVREGKETPDQAVPVENKEEQPAQEVQSHAG